MIQLHVRMHCNNGPYIWDLSNHTEGFGSTLQHRKQSIILSEILGAPWIGTLINKHDKIPRLNNQNWLGLGDENCTMSMLRKYEQNKSIQTINASVLYREPALRIENLCRIKSVPKSILLKYNISKDTAIKVDIHHVHQDWNYCLFSSKFRSRFYSTQIVKEKRVLKPKGDHWIAVHFRWGDVRTNNSEHPNSRAGGGLSRLANHAKIHANNFKNASVFFLSEGTPEDFVHFKIIVPNAIMILNGSWKDALWIMSQSNVLIGGTSSFFVLGAHLCSNCTIVTKTSQKKFKAHKGENTSHHTLLPL